MLSSEGGPETLGPAGSPQLGVSLGYPNGLAGPIDLETQARGQRMFPQPGMETTTSQSAVALSGSGASGPDPAAAVAAGEAPPPTAADTQQQHDNAKRCSRPRV